MSEIEQNKKHAVLFPITSNLIEKRWVIDLTKLAPDTPITDNSAYLIFKNARRLFNIKGKSFIMTWADETFFISKAGETYTTYKLDKSNFVEKKIDGNAVVGESV